MSNFKNFQLDYVLWEVTQKCNLRCIHCRASASPELAEEKIIEGEHAYKLIDEIKVLGSPILALTGGEPLLRKDLFDILNYAKKQKVPTRIQSNGLLLTEEIADKLKKANITSFGFGMDGSRPEIHDKIRNLKGALNKTVQNIKMLKEKGIKVHVEYTITKLNYDDVVPTIKLLESLGVNTFSARAALFSGRSKAGKDDIFQITKEQYKKTLEQLREERYKRKMIITCQDPLYHLVDKGIIEGLKEYGNIASGKILSGCTVGLNMVHINKDGRVGICTFLPDVIIGNIFEKPLSEIWLNRKNNPDVKRLANREYKGNCGKCEDRFICGGCRARALVLNNDLFGEDPYCWKYAKR